MVELSFGVINKETDEIISFMFVNCLPDYVFSSLNEILPNRRMVNVGNGGETYSEAVLDRADETEQRWVKTRRDRLGVLNIGNR